jgi:cyclopropane-fatty-acyl-phospholipid synthase
VKNARGGAAQGNHRSGPCGSVYGLKHWSGRRHGKVRGGFFSRFIKAGSIEIETASGRKFMAGAGTGPKVGLRFKDAAAPLLLMLDPELNSGELYADGRIEISKGSLFDALLLGASNMWRPDNSLRLRLLLKARSALRLLCLPNNRKRAKQNAAHYYDLNAAFYTRYLDSGMQYSCAYFEREGLSLERAQLAKKRHIAAKLLIEPAHKVLDIGCGFGGMAIYLCRFCGAKVTGLTLSQTQLDIAQSAAADLGLTNTTDFRYCDYREVHETFDRIVSVGMFEHVGLIHYEEYFRKVASLLDEDGVALIHTIGRMDGPCATNPWVAKYIFPGGYMPALSEIMPAIERSGLFVTDIEILRLHYAQTLRAWRERFAAQRAEVKARRGERFCRVWELYLAGSEVAFRCGGLCVFQVQLAKKLDSVPLTRDYISRAETYLRGRDSAGANLRLVAK